MPTLLHLALQIAAQCAGSKCGNWPMFYSSLFAANSLQIVYSTIVPCTWLTWQYKTGLTIKQCIAPLLTLLAVNLTAMLRVVSSSDSAWCCLSTDVDSEALTAHNSFSAEFAVLRQCFASWRKIDPYPAIPVFKNPYHDTASETSLLQSQSLFW